MENNIMNRKEWIRQLHSLREHIKNNDFIIGSSDYYDLYNEKPLVSDKVLHYIKLELQWIVFKLQFLKNYKGSKTFKKIYLANFQSYTKLLSFCLSKEINWYYRLKDIIEAGERNE